MPFYDNEDRLGGAVIAALSLNWLAETLGQENVPPGAALAVIDRNGTYLARYPDNSSFVGRKMVGRPGRGPVEVVDLDGVSRIIGYSSLPDAGLLVGYGLDKARAFAGIQSETRRGIFLIILSTVLVLVLTLLGARRYIHRPLGELVKGANQWRLGKFSERVDVRGPSEITRVADAFNTMADGLECRDHELSLAKAKAEEAAVRITMIFESTTDSVLIVDCNWRVSYLNGPAGMQLAEGRDIVGMSPF